MYFVEVHYPNKVHSTRREFIFIKSAEAFVMDEARRAAQYKEDTIYTRINTSNDINEVMRIAAAECGTEIAFWETDE